MGWQVHGTEVGFSYESGEVWITGTAEQYSHAGAATGVDMRKIHGLAAEWEIHLAPKSERLASLMYSAADLVHRGSVTRHLVDPERIVNTTCPLTAISYHAPNVAGDEASVGFTTFLPEQEFGQVLKLAELLALGAPLKYWFGYKFIAFMPFRVKAEQLAPHDLKDPSWALCFDDWLSGVAYWSDKYFIRLQPRCKDSKDSPPSSGRR